MRICLICRVMALACTAQCAPALADDGRFSLGLRGVITVADGEPANDIPGFGVLAHLPINERWNVGIGLDRTEYDFEQPARLIGIAQDPALEPIDVVAEATVLSGWFERTLNPGTRHPTTWFVGAGLGAAFVDVPDASGPREDGGQFNIQTRADTEIIIFALAGLRRRLGERWYLEFAVRADQHFADWQMLDQLSGASGSIDDYLALGGYLAAGLTW